MSRYIGSMNVRLVRRIGDHPQLLSRGSCFLPTAKPRASGPSCRGPRILNWQDRAYSSTTDRKKRSNHQLINHRPLQRSKTDGFVNIDIDGERFQFSPVFLRDICPCPQCVDASTRQKLFCTSDIPSNIQASVTTNSGEGVSIQWTSDIPGYQQHTTELSFDTLGSLGSAGTVHAVRKPMHERKLWDAVQFQALGDFDYHSYMSDDDVLFKALQQLHTHGLLFVTNVPEDEGSVSTVGERIGPLKTTFYGRTWDVRSVPEAKNVAYTSQNLGFHMDLLYMEQPPHLQLLHCIRSSSAGGASTFTDSFRSIDDLTRDDMKDFENLSKIHIHFHYNHPTSNLYHQARTVIEQKPVQFGTKTVRDFDGLLNRRRRHPMDSRWRDSSATDFVDAVSWAPPFQAPFASDIDSAKIKHATYQHSSEFSATFDKWHGSAQKFNSFIHRPELIYERLMQPGECVIFDNRRVLHGRKAFEVGDAGKERWLRGAYIDRDPYLSKLRVLQKRLGPSHEQTLSNEYNATATEEERVAATG